VAVIVSTTYFVISSKPRLREALSDSAFDFLLDPTLWSMMQGFPDSCPRELQAIHIARFRIAYRSALGESPGRIPPIPLSEFVLSNFDHFWTLENLSDPEDYEDTVLHMDGGELIEIAGPELAEEMKRSAQQRESVRQAARSAKGRFRV
jgi:hypothetical protein